MSENNRKTVLRQYAIVTLMTISIVMIAFMTYAHMLRYFFTAMDSLTLIDTSRIQSLKDVTRVFTQPLMAGTRFASETLYYRPIASLSYSLDYYIWGLNPFGYHLTDLILHITVSVLVLIAMLFLTGGRKAISWLSAVIFTTHPILVESVPAIARRQVIIASLFLLLSLIFFLNYISAPTRKRNWSLLFSILVYALALGAQEVAILLPLIVCGYLFAFFSYLGGDKHKSFRVGMFQPMRICLPYFLVTFIYIVWRVYVLRGIGGTYQPFTFSTVIWFSNTFTSYFTDLLYPVPLHGLVPGNLLRTASLVTLFILLMFLFINRKLALMNVQRSDVGRILTFLLVWLLLPLCLFLATRTFDHRNMYISAIPFSAILSIALIESLRLVVRRLTVEQAATNSLWLPYAAGGSFIVVSGLVLYLLSFSPIARTYGEWEDSGRISAMILHKLSEAISELPDHTTIHIYDLPAGIASYETITPHAKSVAYLADYSIKSYLDLTNSDNRIGVVVKNTTVLSTYPRDIDLEMTIEPGGNVAITIKPDE